MLWAASQMTMRWAWADKTGTWMPLCTNCDVAYLDGEPHECAPRRLWWDASMVRTPSVSQVLIAYLVAPLGAAVVAFAMAAYGFSSDDRMPASATFQPGLMVAMGMFIAYAVGLLLLPLFAVFAHFRWLGLRYYLPATVIASVIPAALQVPRSGSPALLFLFFAACGAACAVVFSLVLVGRSR